MWRKPESQGSRAQVHETVVALGGTDVIVHRMDNDISSVGLIAKVGKWSKCRLVAYVSSPGVMGISSLQHQGIAKMDRRDNDDRFFCWASSCRSSGLVGSEE
jgi:hypothetical protein